MHRMMAFSFMVCLVCWMTADVKTARCDEIADLTEYKEYDAEVVGVEPEALVRCNTYAFPDGSYQFTLLYENSVAENVNEFGWTKCPYCREEAELLEVRADQSAQEVGKQPDIPYTPMVCACGGFNKIISGKAHPGQTFFVKNIWTWWLPAFNSHPLRNLHQGGYYTSLKHFNWDHMKHLEVFCLMDPADVEDRPTKSWIFCWWDKCNRPGHPDHFFDSMILLVEFFPTEMCPQVEEIP